MELNSPYFLVVFFGIFHMIGGLAFGKGIRERLTGAKTGYKLMVWGAIMGILPMIFDWFFLIRVDKIMAGTVGPALFILAVILGGIFFTKELSRKHEQSIVAILMGGTAFMLGSMLIPYLIQQAQTRDNLGLVDYLCGGFIPFIFILVGFSFIWTGISAMRKNLTFDEHIAEREIEIEETSNQRKKKREGKHL